MYCVKGATRLWFSRLILEIDVDALFLYVGRVFKTSSEAPYFGDAAQCLTSSDA